MLLSRQRLERVIKEMNLYHGVVEHRGMTEAVDEMRRRLRLMAKEGYIFRVSFDSDSRDLAQSVLDRVLKLIIEDENERRTRETQEANKFLDVERQHTEADLKSKEEALSAFLSKHPELAAETATNAVAGGTIRAADRERLPADGGGQIAALEVQAAGIEGELAAAGQRTTGGGSTIEDPALAAAKARAHADLQAAQAELRDRQARYTNEHPDVKAALRRVADAQEAYHRADAALKAAPRLPVAGPGAPDDAASGRLAAQRRALAAIRSQIAALRSRSAPRPATSVPRTGTSVVAIETEWTRLTREVREARERQEKVESKQFQTQLAATLASGGHAGRFVIADAPFRPLRPVAGGRFKIALVGGAGSLLLALLAIFIAGAFDDRLYAERDVQRLVGDGFVVVIPRLTAKGD
jgi:hypothetical protein